MKKIARKNYFHFLFCCYYRWSERLNGPYFPHERMACAMLSVFLMLIGSIFITIVDWVLGMYTLEFVSKGEAILAIFLLFALINIYFSRKNKGNKIMKVHCDSATPSLVAKVVLSTWLGSLFFLFSL